MRLTIFNMTTDTVQKQWYESWFDSPYYHVLYRHRDEVDAHLLLDNLINVLKPDKNDHILDLACGRGRHSLYLNQQGYKVTGVDLSQASIAHNRKYENDRLHFFEHDMREPFSQSDFNIVFNLFTSFGYFEDKSDNQKTIQAAHSALKPEGFLVIDYLNVEYILENLKHEEESQVDDIKFKISRGIEGDFITKKIVFEDKGVQHTFFEKVRMLTRTDFENYFASVGFRLVDIYGDYDLGAFHAKSKRMILTAQKIN